MWMKSVIFEGLYYTKMHRTRNMKMTYRPPVADVEQLGMEAAILQVSGDLSREDYGNWISDEWGNSL